MKLKIKDDDIIIHLSPTDEAWLRLIKWTLVLLMLSTATFLFGQLVLNAMMKEVDFYDGIREERCSRVGDDEQNPLFAYCTTSRV